MFRVKTFLAIAVAVQLAACSAPHDEASKTATAVKEMVPEPDTPRSTQPTPMPRPPVAVPEDRATRYQKMAEETARHQADQANASNVYMNEQPSNH